MFGRKQQREEGQSLPVRREERGIMPFEEWGMETPFRMMRRLRDEIDQIFSDFGMPTFGESIITPFEHLRPIVPPIDMWETDTDVVVRADLPGVDPNDVEIYTTENSLRIRAETKREEEIKEQGYYRAERRYGRFERMIDLPDYVKPNQAKATFRHGVLEIRLPKTEQAKERMKKVPVEIEEEQTVGTKGGQSGQSRRKKTK